MPMSGLQPFIELSSKRDKWMWIYRGMQFDENMVDNYECLLYSITCPDGQKYIGKKTVKVIISRTAITNRLSIS